MATQFNSEEEFNAAVQAAQERSRDTGQMTAEDPEFEKAEEAQRNSGQPDLPGALAKVQAMDIPDDEKAVISKQVMDRYEEYTINGQSHLPPLILDNPQQAQRTADSLTQLSEGEIESLPGGYSKDQFENALARFERRGQMERFANQLNVDPLGDPVPPMVQSFGADQSVYDHKPGEFAFRGGGSMIPPGGMVDNYGTQEEPKVGLKMENARQAGVDIRSGLDFDVFSEEGSTRLIAGYGPAYLGAIDHFARKRLKEQGIDYPDDQPVVFNEPYTGSPAYYRVDEMGKVRPTLVNGYGADKDDFIEIGLEAPRLIAEMVGAGVGIAASPFKGVGMTASAAAASGVAGATYTKLLKMFAIQMGVPQEQADKITSSEMLYDGLYATGGELLAGAGMGVFRIYQNSKFGGHVLDLTDSQILAHTKAMKESMQPVMEMDARFGVQFNFGAGTLTGDGSLLVAEGQAKGFAKDADSIQIRTNEVNNQLNTMDALNVITGKDVPSYGNPGRNAEQTAMAVRDQLNNMPVGGKDGPTIRGDQREIELASSQLIDLVKSGTDQVYQKGQLIAYRDQFNAAGLQAREWEKALWEGGRIGETRVLGLYDYIGFDRKSGKSAVHLNNGGVPSALNGGTQGSPINGALQSLSDQAQGALSVSGQKAKVSFLEDLGATKKALEARNAGVIDGDAAGLMQGTLDPRYLHELQSQLLRDMRLAKKGVHPDGWNQGDLQLLLDAIDKQVKGADYVSAADGVVLKEADQAAIAESWDLAATATKQRIGLYEKKASKEMTRTMLDSNGDVVLEASPARIRQAILKPNEIEPLNNVLTALGDDATAKAGVARELENLYREKVLSGPMGDKFKQGAHDKFIREYREHLDILGVTLPKNAGDFSRQVAKLQKRVKDTRKILTKTYGVKGIGEESLNPRDIAEDLITGRANPNQLGQLKRDLTRVNPKLWADVQRNVAEFVKEKISKGSGLTVNASSLDNLLRTSGARLGAVLGKRYVKDLNVLRNVVSLVERGKFAKSPNMSNQPAALQLTRALLGPLSKKQRFISAVTRVAKAKGNKALMELLTSPEGLQRFVRIGRLDPTSFAATAQMAELLGEAYVDVFNKDTEQAWIEEGDPQMAAYIGYMAQQGETYYTMRMEEGRMMGAPQHVRGEMMRERHQREKEQKDKRSAMDKERAARGVN
jgi:hypothetical protein